MSECWRRLPVLGRGAPHVGRLAPDRCLAGEPPDRHPAGRRPKWLAVVAHLALGQRPAGGLRQQLLDEHVLLDDHLPAGALPAAGAELAEQFAELGRRELIPRERPDDRLEERNRLHVVGVPHRVVEPEPRAVVVQYERHVAQAQFLDERVEVAGVLEPPVFDPRLVRAPVTDQIGGDAAAERREMRNDVAPDVGRGRITVQQEDRVPRTRLDIVHARSEHLHEVRGVRVVSRDVLLGRRRRRRRRGRAAG